MNTFGVLAAVGAVLAIVWLRCHHRQMGVTENEFWAALWLMTLGGVFGAKALFVWLGWEHYTSGEMHLWRDFGSGFVFFGGLMGALLTGILFAALKGLSFWRGADYFAVALPLGHAVGRVGCFFTGCCPGRAPHPVQLYECLGLLITSAVCFVVLKKVEQGRKPNGAAFCCYGLFYGALRLTLDPLRADGRPERLFGFSHQQGIALGLILVSAICWMFLRNRHFLHSLRLQS